MSEIRKAIIATYAEWTAMSALRSGAPIKSRRDVYTVLRGVDFEVLFADDLGPINHRRNTDTRCRLTGGAQRRHARSDAGRA